MCAPRRATGFPLDDLAFVVRHFLPHLGRDDAYRILKAAGLSRRPAQKIPRARVAARLGGSGPPQAGVGATGADRHPATAPRVAARASDAAPSASLGPGEARRLATASAPGGGKPSRHAVAGGAGGAPPDLPARPGTTAERRAGLPVRVVVIREAGPDGSRVRRPPGADGTGSRVVDPAPTAADRRHRRAGTGATGGEELARTPTARARGGRRVRPTVRPPGPGQEGRRRPTRGRGTPPEGRARHTDRIGGPPAGRGAADHGPPREDRPARLGAPGTGGGRPSPERLEAGIRREVERVAPPTAPVERGRDAPAGATSGGEPATAAAAPARPEAVGTGRGQGIPKAGDRRPRHATVGLAWPRLRRRPDSAPGVRFRGRVGRGRGRVRRTATVALARKLSAAFRRHATRGAVPRGAAFTARAGRTSSRGPDRDRSAGSGRAATADEPPGRDVPPGRVVPPTRARCPRARGIVARARRARPDVGWRGRRGRAARTGPGPGSGAGRDRDDPAERA